MTYSAEDAMRDAEAQEFGHYIEVACQECSESWSVHVYEDEGPTDDQLDCPIDDCGGVGVEI